MSNINNDPNFITLRNKASFAKLSVLICSNLYCTNHYDVNTTIYVEDKINNDWLFHLSCSVCNNTWAICTLCSKFKTKMTNNRMISMHRSQHHRKLNKRLSQDNENTIINNMNPVLNNNDNENVIIDSSQLEFDITIGSSVGEQDNIQIDNKNNEEMEYNNKKIVVKEKDQFNLLKDEKEAIKIASIVSFFEFVVCVRIIS